VGDKEFIRQLAEKKSLGRQAYKEGFTMMDCKERVWGCGQNVDHWQAVGNAAKNL